MIDFIGSVGLIFVVSAAVFGPLSGWLAGRRGRNPIIWLGFGALLGPLAIVLLIAAPPGRCPLCDSAVRGWAGRCEVCGAGLTTRAQAAMDAPSVAGAGPAPLAPSRVSEPPSGGPIPLPVGRPSRGRRASLTAPAGDRYASPINRVFDGRATIESGTVLATAVYFGGTARLVVGSRYVLVRDLETLQLLGPVDLDPSIVALERPLAGLTATAIGERLVITEGADDRVSLAIALGAFAGASGPQLEIELAAPDETPGTRSDRPASR